MKILIHIMFSLGIIKPIQLHTFFCNVQLKNKLNVQVFKVRVFMVSICRFFVKEKQ